MHKNILLSVTLLSFSSVYAQHDLDNYIQSAKQNSPLIHDHLNQSKANLAEIERIKAIWQKPQIAVTGAYTLSPVIAVDNGATKFIANPESAGKYYGYDLATSNGGQYQALLHVSQPLLNGQRYGVLGEQANTISQTNLNNAKLAGHDIEKIVADQYILCLQDLKQVDFSESMIQLLGEQKSILVKLAESGLMKQTDLMLINIEFQNNSAQLISWRATYRKDLADLNIICGINDTTFVILNDVALTLKADVNTNNSGFMNKYHFDSLSIVYNQKNFELKYKPQLNFFGNTGLNAVYLPTAPNRFGASAGLSLYWNLSDGGQRRITQQKTNYLLKSVAAYQSNFVTLNDLRKRKIISELQSYDERLAITKNQLDDYNTLVNAYKKELMQGQVSVINFINTLKNMASLQRDYLILQTNKSLLTNAYNYWNW